MTTSSRKIFLVLVLISFGMFFSAGAVHAQNTLNPTTPFTGTAVDTTPTNISNPASTNGYCSVTTDMSNLKNIFHTLTCLLENSVLPLLFLIALALFIWGVVKFIGNSDSTEREQGQQFMIWGVIGLAVLFSIWGLINLFGTTFKVRGLTPTIPVTSPQTIQDPNAGH